MLELSKRAVSANARCASLSAWLRMNQLVTFTKPHFALFATRFSD